MSKSLELEGAEVAAVDGLEELTALEERERHRLELRVARAFYEAGAALRRLRDERLYRSTHKTFQEYCCARFGMTRRKGDYLICAAGIFENLEMRTNRSQILPTNLEQIKPLMTLPEPLDQWTAWSDAVDDNDGKVPSGKIVKGVVSRMKEKPPALARNFCSVGDVFTLTRLEGEYCKYNGYPSLALELKQFTVDVEVYDTTLTVKPENLKPIDSPDVRRQLPTTIKRIKRVRNVGLLDRGAYYVLEGLGRQTYLTDFESKLLSFLEKEHGIEPNP